MSRVAILDDFQGVADRLVDWSALGEGVEVVVIGGHPEGDELVAALDGFDVVLAMRERTAFPREVIDALTTVRHIASTGPANAAIDVAAAAARGIIVSGTSSGFASTVEIAWALILAAVKGTVAADADVRAGRWQVGLPSDLAGHTLGLLGLGRIGAAMVPIARAFGMDVVAWSANLTDERATEVGAVRVTKDSLLERSDVVSIHLRLSRRTRGLIGAAELARMRPSAILVNTSRGPIVDEDALVAALSARSIRGAGLDVFDREPLDADHPLCRLGNVVLAPHLGYASEANLAAYYAGAFENIAAWLAGRPVRLIPPPSH